MVVSCTVIRLHPASGAVVDEAIYPVNRFWREPARNTVLGRERARRPHRPAQPPGGLGAGVGRHRALWRFRATGAEAADSASSRPRICAATERVYAAAPDGVACVSVEFEPGVQRHRQSQNSPDLGEVRPFGQQSAGRDVEHRLPVPRATSTRCRLGASALAHVQARKRPTCR